MRKLFFYLVFTLLFVQCKKDIPENYQELMIGEWEQVEIQYFDNEIWEKLPYTEIWEISWTQIKEDGLAYQLPDGIDTTMKTTLFGEFSSTLTLKKVNEKELILKQTLAEKDNGRDVYMTYKFKRR